MDEIWREVSAVWKGEHTFVGENAAGGTVQMGNWEGNPGIYPMELLLVSLAGCTGVDVADILVKKRQSLEKLQVKVRGKRVDTYPKVYDEIEVIYLITGNGIDPKAVEQAITLSEEKYCSVSAMLRGTAKITTSYQILQV